jgi:Tfp pilus assembly protein PilX
MRRTERRAGRGIAGFATTTALGLVAVVALLSVGALHDALFGEQLAASRLLHHRATALSDLGVQHAMARIAAMTAPAGANYALAPMPGSGDNVSVALRHVGSAPLPQGFSLGHLAAHRFEIESTGYTARGIRMMQVQGVVRVMPVVMP